MRFVNLSLASLDGAHITDTRFNKADMTGADLSGATISDTSFYGASMTSVNLRGAALDHCDMSDADIRGLDLSNATVSDLTVSDSTRLDGVTFSRDQMGRIRDSNGRFVGEKTLTERGATVID